MKQLEDLANEQLQIINNSPEISGVAMNVGDFSMQFNPNNPNSPTTGNGPQVVNPATAVSQISDNALKAELEAKTTELLARISNNVAPDQLLQGYSIEEVKKLKDSILENVPDELKQTLGRYFFGG